MTKISTVLAVSGSLYLLPKVLGYLTTDPFAQEERPGDPNLEERNLSVVSKFRKETAAYTEILKSNVGSKNWNFMMGVLVDNLWISHLAISVIMRNNSTPINIKKIVIVGMGYLGISCLTWGARYVILKNLRNANRQISEFIATRSFDLGEDNNSSAPGLRMRPVQDEPNPIPERYHDDPILATRTCPITQEPTSEHVGDPTTFGKVTYSKNAAEQWLGEKRTSPMTRQPLDISQLQERPVRNMLVNDRVRYLKTQEEKTEKKDDSHD